MSGEKVPTDAGVSVTVKLALAPAATLKGAATEDVAVTPAALENVMPETCKIVQLCLTQGTAMIAERSRIAWGDRPEEPMDSGLPAQLGVDPRSLQAATNLPWLSAIEPDIYDGPWVTKIQVPYKHPT